MITGTDRALVVLLHGWPVTEAHWRHLIPILRRAGYHPVPITLPGLGEQADGLASFRKTDLARWLSDVLAGWGITRFAVIGHDWGATVAAHLAATQPSAVTALVVEEEILPGVDIEIPAPGREYYPSWHGPVNRAVGLAEDLIPGRESAYYGHFLRQSAGPAGLDPEVTRAYVDAYSAPGVLQASLGYYRSQTEDVPDLQRLATAQIAAPVLAVGGRFALGTAVAAGMRMVASNVTDLVLERSGHYPLEQEPEPAGDAVVEFLNQHAV